MQFQFENAIDFFTMAGHGPYVWASYAITLLALVILVALPFSQKKSIAVRIKRQQRIESSTITDVAHNNASKDM